MRYLDKKLSRISLFFAVKNPQLVNPRFSFPCVS
jgi:hypothetical protein